jgi:hypothetical protein
MASGPLQSTQAGPPFSRVANGLAFRKYARGDSPSASAGSQPVAPATS